MSTLHLGARWSFRSGVLLVMMRSDASLIEVCRTMGEKRDPRVAGDDNG
jgi:hypothetical protein